MLASVGSTNKEIVWLDPNAGFWKNVPLGSTRVITPSIITLLPVVAGTAGAAGVAAVRFLVIEAWAEAAAGEGAELEAGAEGLLAAGELAPPSPLPLL